MDNIKYKEVFRKQKKDYLNAIEDNYIKNFSAKVQRIAEERTAVIQQYARQIKQVEATGQLANSIDNILIKKFFI